MGVVTTIADLSMMLEHTGLGLVVELPQVVSNGMGVGVVDLSCEMVGVDWNASMSRSDCRNKVYRDARDAY